MKSNIKVTITSDHFKRCAGYMSKDASPIILALRSQGWNRTLKLKEGKRYEDGYRILSGPWYDREVYAVPKSYNSYDLRDIEKKEEDLVLILTQLR